MSKKWLCVEDGEQFILPAATREQAQEDASMYNGHVIRELRPTEYASFNPAKPHEGYKIEETR